MAAARVEFVTRNRGHLMDEMTAKSIPRLARLRASPRALLGGSEVSEASEPAISAHCI